MPAVGRLWPSGDDDDDDDDDNIDNGFVDKNLEPGDLHPRHLRQQEPHSVQGEIKNFEDNDDYKYQDKYKDKDKDKDYTFAVFWRWQPLPRRVGGCIRRQLLLPQWEGDYYLSIIKIIIGINKTDSDNHKMIIAIAPMVRW